VLRSGGLQQWLALNFCAVVALAGVPARAPTAQKFNLSPQATRKNLQTALVTS